jgi:single-stranded-DNA-specific exonuclease
MHRRWLLKRTNPEYIDYLSRSAGISPALAQILINREIKTPEEVRAFMSPGMDTMCDPFEVEGIPALVETILGAKGKGLRLFVHGDYDADGLTATAIMVGALRLLGMEVDYYIPNRFSTGYGFHPHAVDRAKEFGAGLIITVDCGITSFEAADAAKASGIDLIITDHHEPAASDTGNASGSALPEALAIINPKLSALDTTFAGLSGAGIALKAVQALAMKDNSIDPREYIALAALGTLADSVPLTGENRIIVREGLPIIDNSQMPGLVALKEVAGLTSRSINARLATFTLVPRINAAGRLGDASEVVELMLTDSPRRSEEIAKSLQSKNSERQKQEEEVLAEALKVIEKEGYGPAIVLAGEGWSEGVVGIVASRLVDLYERPSFVLSIKDGVAKGSARSVQGFDVHAALAEARPHLIGFGGHKQAAGLRLRASELEAFRKKMEAVAASHMEEFTPVLDIDAEVDLKDVTYSLVNELDALEPFGYGNPEPVLGSRDLEVINPRVVGNNHLKVKLRRGNCAHDAIGWGMGELLDLVESAGRVDAAFAATINDWNGSRLVQLSLKGLRGGGEDNKS